MIIIVDCKFILEILKFLSAIDSIPVVNVIMIGEARAGIMMIINHTQAFSSPGTAMKEGNNQ